MKIYTKGHYCVYELEKLTRLFFPFEKVEFCDYKDFCNNGELCAVTVINDDDFFTAVYFNDRFINRNGKVVLDKRISDTSEKQLEKAVALKLFECYFELTGYLPEWGILTGIRPAKLYRKYEEEIGTDETDKMFLQRFSVSKNKLELLKMTAKSEDEIISKSTKKSVSIYISIPFCPSRCSYCSFVSHSIERAAELIPVYFDLLIKEIKRVAQSVKNLNLSVMTVYVGGGTPTTLNAEQLAILLDEIHKAFGNEFCELTVEAGRPDTITYDKLAAIKNGGADRISINPQTMNDEVLKAIGRRHTAKQMTDAFELARKIGFENINTDLIAGLPSDTFESFQDTLEKVINLNPDSVTVHSLSLKRSSKIIKAGDTFSFEDGILAQKSVDFAKRKLIDAKIIPYYMYRQSKTVGNLENVGYAKLGKEGLYNVYIMDETHTILACGASAVTKLKAFDDGKIERIFNYKYPYEYISKFDEIMRRKDKIEEFYNEHSF